MSPNSPSTTFRLKQALLLLLLFLRPRPKASPNYPPRDPLVIFPRKPLPLDKYPDVRPVAEAYSPLLGPDNGFYLPLFAVGSVGSTRGLESDIVPFDTVRVKDLVYQLAQAGGGGMYE